MKSEKVNPEMGKRLNKALSYRNMSQRTLAKEAHYSPQQINKIVNGSARLTHDAAAKFAEILNIDEGFLLLKTPYMTEDEHIHDVAQSQVNEGMALFSFISALGYKFIDMRENPDGSKESMHKRYKDIRINDTDTDEQILDKARTTPPVRYYIIESPDGTRAHVEMDELTRIQKSIRDFAVFQLEQPFQFQRQIQKMVHSEEHPAD